MSHISRRSLLRHGGALTLGGAIAGHAGIDLAKAPEMVPLPPSDPKPFVGNARLAAPAWRGHQPGKIYLGMSTNGDISEDVRRTGAIGVHRHYYQWSFGRRERSTISSDHRLGRLPWISFKPPGGASSWKQIGDGRYDAAIRERARGYAAFSEPVIVTFHHEPAEEARSSRDLPRQWRRAFCRIHDVMQDETGLRNVAFVPIIGDYTFNPWNKKDRPGDWATPDVVSRSAFFGLDLYQNQSGEGYAERIGRVREHLADAGHPSKMVGLGETGVAMKFANPSAVTWWRTQWDWSSRNTDKIGVISYFNSNVKPSRPNWRLTEHSSKLAAYRTSLSSSKACRL